MRLLLDTQVFLWYISADKRLPMRFVKAIRAPENDVFLSVVSLWEAIIKYDIGKLPLPQAPATYLPTQRRRHAIASLPVYETAVLQLAVLPPGHRDPFDRLLICQAKAHGLHLATVDDVMGTYPVDLF